MHEGVQRVREDLPNGPDEVPQAANASEFGENLRRLRNAAGLSVHRMEQASKKMQASRGLSHSTIARVENGRLPDPELLDSFLKICRVGARQRRKWDAVRKKLAGKSQAPVVSRPVGTWSPFDLDLHRAFSVGTSELPDLTPYRHREHDQELSNALTSVTSSIMIVLVGESSTGKTRAALNALSEHLPDWPMLFPHTGTELVSMLTSSAVGGRTVLWLNELRNYLSGGEEAAVELRRLLADARRGPVVVLSTMWPRDWRDLTAEPTPAQPDLHHHARKLLLHAAQCLRVPEGFSPQEVKDLCAHPDPRLATAAATAGRHGRVIQVLTGGPALVDRHEHPAKIHERYAVAVTAAAMDVARIGYHSLIPKAVLAATAAVNLDPADRANPPTDWFDIGLHHATTPIHGICALEALRNQLDPGPEDGYRLHDYLDQHARTRRARLSVPEAIWTALVTHATDPDDRVRLALAAERRGLFRFAEALCGTVAYAGNGEAMRQLARLWESQERYAEAEEMWRRTVEDGHPGALSGLARLLEQLGRLDEAEHALRDAVDGGGLDGPMLDIADFYERHKRLAECEQVWRQAIDAGVAHARSQLASRLDRWGRIDEAEQLYRDEVAHGDTAWGLSGLAWIAERRGQFDEAIQLYNDAIKADKAANSGARQALLGLLCSLRRNFTISLRDAGDLELRSWLSDVLAHQGKIEEALDLWRQCHWGPSELPLVRWQLAELHERSGQVAEAEQLWLEAMTTEEPGAYANLAELLDRHGRTAEAEKILREGTIAGTPNAFTGLINLLNKHGRTDEADRLRRYGLNPDGSPAAMPLLNLRASTDQQIGDSGAPPKIIC